MNPILGMLLYLMNWFIALLFSGIIFRGEDVVWPLRALYYVYPLQYLMNSLSFLVMRDATYEGAVPCAIDPLSCPKVLYDLSASGSASPQYGLPVWARALATLTLRHPRPNHHPPPRPRPIHIKYVGTPHTTPHHTTPHRTTLKGFYCPDDATGGLQCFGADGLDVLATLETNYEVNIAHQKLFICTNVVPSC